MAVVERLAPRWIEGVERVVLPGGGFVLVHPARGTCVEIGADDAPLLAAFDGARSLAEIARGRAEATGEPGFRRLVPLCRDLAAAGLLALPNGQIWPPDWHVEPAGGPRQRPWRLTLAASKPFRPPFPRLPVGLVPALTALAAAALVMFVPWRAPDNAWTHLNPTQVVLWAWLATGLALSVRTVARAKTALAASGRLHRLGLTFHYTIPVLTAQAGEAARAGRPGRVSLALAGLAGSALGTLLAATVATVSPGGALAAGASVAALVSAAALLGHLCPLLPGDAGALLAELAPDDRFAPRLRAYLSRGILRGMMRASLERRGIALRPQEERFYLTATMACGLWMWLALEVQQLAGTHVVDPVLVPLSGQADHFPLNVLAALLAGGLTVASVGIVVLAALPVVLWSASLLLPGRAHRPRPPADDAPPSADELARQPLFARLDPATRRALAAQVRLERFARGDVVVRQGDPGESFYAIRTGQADVLVEDHTGLRTRVATLAPGDAFGELALVGEGRRKATVRAASALVLLRLDRVAFERALSAQSLGAAEVTELLRETQLLRELPFFADFSADALARLSLALKPHLAGPGEEVVRQGEPGEHFFLVQSGTLDVYRDGAVVGRLGRGDCFGEVALLQNVPRTATVVCVEDAHLLRLDETDFLRAVDESFRFGEHVDALGARRR